MPAPHFDYIAPTTVDEAVAALVKGGKDARVMAGGTDLMVKIRHRALFPKQLISLKRIDGLNAITFDEKSGLTIGATALLADVASHPVIRQHYPPWPRPPNPPPMFRSATWAPWWATCATPPPRPITRRP